MFWAFPPSDAFSQIVANEGVATLWNGTLPSLILVLNPAVQFMIYEAMKRKAGRGGKKVRGHGRCCVEHCVTAANQLNGPLMTEMFFFNRIKMFCCCTFRCVEIAILCHALGQKSNKTKSFCQGISRVCTIPHLGTLNVMEIHLIVTVGP